MEEFFKQCESKLQMTSRLHENGACIIWTGCVNKQGYGQFRFRDPRDPPTAGHKTRTSHRVALMVQLRDFNVPFSQQASHLCNNKLCINVQHLVFERSSSNNLRKTCFAYLKCSGHFDVDGKRLPDCKVHLAEN